MKKVIFIILGCITCLACSRKLISNVVFFGESDNICFQRKQIYVFADGLKDKAGHSFYYIVRWKDNNSGFLKIADIYNDTLRNERLFSFSSKSGKSVLFDGIDAPVVPLGIVSFHNDGVSIDISSDTSSVGHLRRIGPKLDINLYGKQITTRLVDYSKSIVSESVPNHNGMVLLYSDNRPYWSGNDLVYFTLSGENIFTFSDISNDAIDYYFQVLNEQGNSFVYPILTIAYSNKSNNQQCESVGDSLYCLQRHGVEIKIYREKPIRNPEKPEYLLRNKDSLVFVSPSIVFEPDMKMSIIDYSKVFEIPSSITPSNRLIDPSKKM